MNDEIEITKDFHIATPTEQPSRYSGDIGRLRRAWKVGEVEGAMWQARAAGANDDTEVELNHKGITVKALPAFPIEIPPAMRRRSTRMEPEPEPPVSTRVLVHRALVVLAGLVLVPSVVLLVVTVWRLVLGVLW